MTVAVDASLLVAALTDTGPVGEWAEGLLTQGEAIAPHLALVETVNVLRRCELGGRLSRLEAGAAARDLVLLHLELLPFTPFAARVWELRTNLTSYDAWYVAVAEAFDVPLATLDGRLTVVEDPGSAHSPVSPAAALARTAVRHVLPLSGIAGLLRGMVQVAPRRDAAT